MISRADDRAQVASVKPRRRQVAMPSGGVERVERVAYCAQLVAPLDHDLPRPLILLGQKGPVDARGVEHGGIEDRLVAEDAFVGKLLGVACRLEQERGQRRSGFDSPCGAAREPRLIVYGHVTKLTAGTTGTSTDKGHMANAHGQG